MGLRHSRPSTLEFEKNMKLGPSAFLLFLSLFSSLCVARAAPAGYDEGYAAYQTHDYAGALADWKPLAEQGDLHAQYALGTMHKQGEGIPADWKQAMYWFRKAAEQGHAASQYELGAVYLGMSSAKTVPLDRQQGLFWLAKAAEQNYAPAKSMLALSEASVYEQSSQPDQPLSVVAGEEEQTLGSRVFGPLYDLIGWIIAATLFAYLAFRSRALHPAIRGRLPSFLLKKNVCLSIAALATIVVTVSAVHWW